MHKVHKACLCILAVAIMSAAGSNNDGAVNQAALCDGRRYELERIPQGASPYIGLNAKDSYGYFLLDYGATRSLLSKSVLDAPKASTKNIPFSLPELGSAEFVLADRDMPLHPAGRQIGVIGTDVLSRLSVQISEGSVFIGAQPCQPDLLRTHGLIPIPQRQFFSFDPSQTNKDLPNVPVVFLRLGRVATWAQLDTGYDDVVYRHSIDINEAFWKLLVEEGIEVDAVGRVEVVTCEGHEVRPVYKVKGLPLEITDQTKPILKLDDFHLILKPVNRCGGIAEMRMPAAQIGASFLTAFRTVVFDPKSERVWLDGGKANSRSR